MVVWPRLWEVAVEIIGKEKIVTFDQSGRLKELSCFDVRKSEGTPVENYLDLVKKIAVLQYENPHYVLLYRGQPRDYKRTTNRGSEISTIKPSIFRGTPAPGANELMRKFNRLRDAEQELVSQWRANNLPEFDRLVRQKIIQWAILQHYEICATPLLDVTQSLRIAASFACSQEDDNVPIENNCFLLVLGVPHLAGAITASSEAGVQILRLSSICPPNALRPHIQEGFLVGEYPELSSYDQKQNYDHAEIDCARRIVAKFVFDPQTFWTATEFPLFRWDALYPNQGDPLFTVAQNIKAILNR